MIPANAMPDAILEAMNRENVVICEPPAPDANDH
jgi:hypothetical protein